MSNRSKKCHKGVVDACYVDLESRFPPSATSVATFSGSCKNGIEPEEPGKAMTWGNPWSILILTFSRYDLSQVIIALLYNDLNVDFVVSTNLRWSVREEEIPI